jgi:hypothetical protein
MVEIEPLLQHTREFFCFPFKRDATHKRNREFLFFVFFIPSLFFSFILFYFLFPSIDQTHREKMREREESFSFSFFPATLA